MRAVVQRVSRAAVRIAGGGRREIGRGLVVLLGVGPKDTADEAAKLAEKISNLRVFPGESGKLDLSLLDLRGEALVVSQFTLYGDCRKGRRPDFTSAAAPELAEPLYRAFVEALESRGVPVRTGEFGAQMEVELVNEGPVTLAMGFGSNDA
jgi:D-tyrosyl-tRNA(Tyr) deacylase